MSHIVPRMSRIALISILTTSCAQVGLDARARNGSNNQDGKDARGPQIEPDRSATQIPAEIDPPPTKVDPE